MTMGTPLERWVDEAARITQPDRVVWCDGSDQEFQGLIEKGIQDKTFQPLDQKRFPGCYLHRSHPSDVARTEHLTFICTDRKEDVGPNNNWMSPQEARAKVTPLF